MNTTFAPRQIVVAASTLIALMTLSTTASFAGNWANQHPRRAEVLGRDNRINNRLNSDRGQLGGHYGQLKGEDQAIRQQEQADARFNGGHITKGEQRQLNGEENRVNSQIRNDYTGNSGGGGGFAQNHPRRAEVLGRDNNLNNQLTADKGNLDGHYGQLSREDSAIRQQEQSDARFNGGYISTAQQNQLNREENHVQNQINRDDQ
jgi:hypothetical protein